MSGRLCMGVGGVSLVHAVVPVLPVGLLFRVFPVSVCGVFQVSLGMHRGMVVLRVSLRVRVIRMRVVMIVRIRLLPLARSRVPWIMRA